MQKTCTLPLLAFAFAALISIGAARAGAEVSGPVEAINADAKTATIIVHRLRGHYSVLEGSGGNIGVLTGPGSNHVDEWNHTFTPAPLAARPTVLVSDRKTLHIDGATLKLKYYGLAHTDGDISVYYPEADILQTGDTWWNGYYPMIDYGAGGSIDGMIRAANINIALATEKTIVVPGHGPVGNRDELVAYRDMLVAIRNNVAKLKQSGMSLPQIIAAKPTAAFDQKWGGFVIGPDLFTSLVYRGL
jgi:glyoxylase-like metal-dependent hydrolase (beta-lactamase superfamily II)